MKYAYDLYLEPKTQEDLFKMILLADHMGYDGISVSLSKILRRILTDAGNPQLGKKNLGRTVKNTLKKMSILLGRIGEKLDIAITSRVTTWFDSKQKERSFPQDSLKELTRFKKPYRNIIIAFKARTEKEIRRALKFHRPYLVSISIKNIGLLNKKICNLSRQFYKPLEISLRDLIFSSPPRRGSLLSDLREVNEIINKPHFKVVFSSGAQKPIEMRSIREIRSLLEAMKVKKKKIISSYKLSSDFLFQPKPAVFLDEENVRNTNLINQLEGRF